MQAPPAPWGEPVVTRGARLAFVQRAFAGVSLRAVWPVLLLVAAYALSRSIGDVVVAAVEGRLGPWLIDLGEEFACHLLIAAVMYGAVVATGNLGPQSGWRRGVALGLAIALATPAAVLILAAWIHAPWSVPPDGLAQVAMAMQAGALYALLAAVLTVLKEVHRREQASLEIVHRTDLDRIDLERQMAQARLQLMQAQIEPHFLFNTLANVRRLCETDRDAGRRMLENLMRYFAIALPTMRRECSTLGCEIRLIEAYLNVQKIRMGRRLEFAIAVPDALRSLQVPPMMLLTLVENAVKHGLNPMPDGGSITVAAHARRDCRTRPGDAPVLAADARAIAGGGGAGTRACRWARTCVGATRTLTITVTDTGRGLLGESGTGTGLANIRARLAAAYGESARLSLQANAPRGIVATLVLPRSARAAGQGGD